MGLYHLNTSLHPPCTCLYSHITQFPCFTASHTAKSHSLLLQPVLLSSPTLLWGFITSAPQLHTLCLFVLMYHTISLLHCITHTLPHHTACYYSRSFEFTTLLLRGFITSTPQVHPLCLLTPALLYHTSLATSHSLSYYTAVEFITLLGALSL